MKIDSFDINTNSTYSSQKIEYTSNRFTALNGSSSLPQETPDSDAVKMDLSDNAKQMISGTQEEQQNALQEMAKKALSSQAASKIGSTADFAASVDDLKIKMLEQMIYALSGKRVSFQMLRPSDLKGSSSPFAMRNADLAAIAAAQQGERQIAFEGYSLESEHFQHESESMTYQAQGLIHTADGKTISVDVNLSMSREYTSYSYSSVQLERLKDPLVINFGGNAASLTGEKFDFDLDMDGSMDKISFVGEGSGFLALDKNGDGKINDGSELFGPNTGSGFDELRAYDQDSNGWIDENDDIFGQLRVWSKDKDGKDQLFTLKELGIGAIYLGETNTQFSMKDSANSTQGVVRSTSFFLKENGEAGTVNHIDLAL